MRINTNEAGESVYLQLPIEERQDSAVYRTVRRIVGDIATEDTVVLDVGCSDGVVNYKEQMAPVDMVLGVDLAFDAVRANGNEIVAQAEATKLPLRDDSVDVVLALDIVEHFPASVVPAIFEECERVGRNDHTVIVSMPLISPHRLLAIREGMGTLRNGWPQSGLFDRTHQIFRDARGHRKLFRSSGYRSVFEVDTIGMTNASHAVGGDSFTDATTFADGHSLGKRLVGQYVRHAADSTRMSRVLAHLLAYQRIYVLKKNDYINE